MRNFSAIGFIIALIFGAHIIVEFMMSYVPYLGIIVAPALFTYLLINAVRYYKEETN